MSPEIGNGLINRLERAVYAALSDVLQLFGNSAVNHSALGWRIFVMRGL